MFNLKLISHFNSFLNLSKALKTDNRFKVEKTAVYLSFNSYIKIETTKIVF
jgi:hypothetical protein